MGSDGRLTSEPIGDFMTTPPKKRRRSGDDEDPDWVPPTASPTKKKAKKKTKTGKKPLPTKTKKTIKAAVTPPVTAILATTSRTRMAPVATVLAPLAIITAAAHISFADPGDCPDNSGEHMGCQQMTITLGPKQQFGQAGTNSSNTYPRALAAVRIRYPLQTFKSGHVLNADFGGADEARNMTVLTSSANTQQTLFDTALKNAQNALYNVYAALASCNPTNPGLLGGLAYGISVTITMGGGTRGPSYPDNCVSNQMALQAVIQNEANILAAAANLANFANPKPGTLNGVRGLCAQVRGFVTKANTRNLVDNTWLP
jgi:hypothetical protein